MHDPQPRDCRADSFAVCEIVEGDMCDDPPASLCRFSVPDPRVFFTSEEVCSLSICLCRLRLNLVQDSQVIRVTDRCSFECSIKFGVDHEFWEVVRLIAEAKVAAGIRRENIVNLTHQAIAQHVPTVIHAVAAVEPQAEEEQSMV